MSPTNIHIDITTSEKKQFIPLKDEPHPNESREPNLLWHFTDKILTLEKVTQVEFDVYGKLIQNSEKHEEEV